MTAAWGLEASGESTFLGRSIMGRTLEVEWGCLGWVCSGGWGKGRGGTTPDLEIEFGAWCAYQRKKAGPGQPMVASVADITRG